MISSLSNLALLTLWHSDDTLLSTESWIASIGIINSSSLKPVSRRFILQPLNWNHRARITLEYLWLPGFGVKCAVLSIGVPLLNSPQICGILLMGWTTSWPLFLKQHEWCFSLAFVWSVHVCRSAIPTAEDLSPPSLLILSSLMWRSAICPNSGNCQQKSPFEHF